MPKASGTAEAPARTGGTGSITLFNIQPNDIGAEVVGQDSTAPAGVAAVMAWWGSCRPGSRSVTVREWGRRGASRAAPRGKARQPSLSWPAASRAVPPFIVPLACHSR